jgi:alpha-tubulin suppressor-like RCC1 family protein
MIGWVKINLKEEKLKQYLSCFKEEGYTVSFIIGQLGDGTSGINAFSVAVNNSGVLSGKNILKISCGKYHTCVIANDSNSYCWGNNE